MTVLTMKQFDPSQYRVLVCMNKQTQREWLTGCLRHNHYQAEACESWKALQKALDESPPTLVVSDYGFDRFPAMEIGVEIYRYSTISVLPVVFLIPRTDIVVDSRLKSRYVNWVHKDFLECAHFCQHLQRVIVQMETSNLLKSQALELMRDPALESRGNALMGKALDLVGDTDASEYYERAIAADPLYSEACLELGDIYARRGQKDLAAAAFEKAIYARPDYAVAYLKLGDARWFQGNQTAAQAAWEKAVEIGDEDVVRSAERKLQPSLEPKMNTM